MKSNRDQSPLLKKQKLDNKNDIKEEASTSVECQSAESCQPE